MKQTKEAILKVLNENAGENMASVIAEECNLSDEYEYILDFLVIGGRVFDEDQIAEYIISMIEVKEEGIYF